jgi:hypothetical protein
VISCLMPTRDRPERAAAAVRQFLAQDHPAGDRELLVGVDGRSSGRDMYATIDGMEGVLGVQKVLGTRPTVKFFLPNAMSLPALRHHLLQRAQGELVTVWDDDDLRPPDYLSAHAAALAACPGAVVSYVSHFLHLTERPDGTMDAAACRYPWGGGLPGTAVWRRSALDRYPIPSGNEETGADSVLQARLAQLGPAVSVAGRCGAYGYVFHGQNVWSVAHHAELVERCRMPGVVTSADDLRALGLDPGRVRFA